MKKMVAVLVVLFIGSIGLMGCGGGGGGGTAQAQVPNPGGGAFTIPGAPRFVEEVYFISTGGHDFSRCYVDGDIEVVNNLLIFKISGGSSANLSCAQFVGREIIVPADTGVKFISRQ